MHDDYYLNTLYPLQDNILEIVGKLSVRFYLTGGTALSRAYLHHRYSDDLDFFVNGSRDFKTQVNTVIESISKSGYFIDVSVADDSFARMFVFEDENSLKLDFVNDVPFRSGTSILTPLYINTDNLHNILSNKITALSRYLAKDLVDIVYICQNHKFSWENIMNDAFQKDIWVNPINVVEVLEQFPVENLDQINWITQAPSYEWFQSQINRIIPEILDGNENSLHK